MRISFSYQSKSSRSALFRTIKSNLSVMSLILFAVSCLVACASAGLVSPLGYAAPIAYGAPALGVPSLTTQHQNTLRSFGNLGQVSTFSKTIDTPFSSVRKADVRVSNPGYAVAAPSLAYAPAIPRAPLAYAAAAPLGLAHPLGLGSPLAKIASPAVVAGHGLLGVAYSAAPTVSHMTYSNGLGLSYAW